MKTFSQISLTVILWRKAATQTFVVLLFHLTSVSDKAIAVSLSLIQLSFFLTFNFSTSPYSRRPLR
jgi:hypothetical protein